MYGGGQRVEVDDSGPLRGGSAEALESAFAPNSLAVYGGVEVRLRLRLGLVVRLWAVRKLSRVLLRQIPWHV